MGFIAAQLARAESAPSVRQAREGTPFGVAEHVSSTRKPLTLFIIGASERQFRSLVSVYLAVALVTRPEIFAVKW